MKRTLGFFLLLLFSTLCGQAAPGADHPAQLAASPAGAASRAAAPSTDEPLTPTPASIPSKSYLPVMRRPLPTVEMVTIPTGNFFMGCSPKDSTCHRNEQPGHTVYLDTYLIDKFEVTNGLYNECIAARACLPPSTNASVTHPDYLTNPAYAQYPVVAVTWYQADAFCAWLGKRLPTEAEWEKAARGEGSARIFPWGNGQPNCDLMNFMTASGAFCVGDMTPVGAYPQNTSPYGVMDMAGNVWEWVYDWYGEDYYSSYAAEAWPANPQGPAGGDSRVVKGGAWDTGDRGGRISRREGGLPFDLDTSSGFRCAQTPGG